ncbi:Fic family protein [Micromonospora aurantiaca (nom. illeg.)]|uniref:Fic family protein n=1 Tax=Micromonospora aurantiaca (nom. illeg.) TaxID=47850 RepID=A0ABQ6UGE2_9ACTN|nr:Fic family protein [Micromonospora aurantiaca]KAB1111976.1 Fic family protein [Micromonospora aurantiaca]
MTATRSRPRSYQDTHPWITFDRLDLQKLSWRTWQLLGEAESKCQHVAGVPLRPQVASDLYTLYFSKGVHGTASIEGNTLSEEEVRRRVEGDLPLPPSRAYLGQEIDNIVAGANRILADLRQGRPMELTVERIESFNSQVLAGLDLDPDVVPGEIRTHRVGVMRYLAPEADDCRHLLDEMCRWLNNMNTDDQALKFPVALLKAVLAHLYIAWIHPFGDGNGRTARLIEFQLLVQAGLPVASAHLLSDFYNKTRTRYYQELDRTSHPPYPIEKFIHYAVEGFVDELRDQLEVIRKEQMRVTWENFVHQSFHSDSPAKRRQKMVVLDLTTHGAPVPTSKLPELTPRLATEYATKGDKTLSRDVNVLTDMKLIKRVRGGLIANTELIRAFLPERSQV